MAPRLLSFLSLVETALIANGSTSLNTPPQRAVNFHKGIARLTFADGSGTLQLQSFVLADGQTCVKVAMVWAGNPYVGLEAVYPQGNFNWATAAEKVAAVWMAGPRQPAAAPIDSLAAPAQSASLAAVG